MRVRLSVRCPALGWLRPAAGGRGSPVPSQPVPPAWPCGAAGRGLGREISFRAHGDAWGAGVGRGVRHGVRHGVRLRLWRLRARPLLWARARVQTLFPVGFREPGMAGQEQNQFSDHVEETRGVGKAHLPVGENAAAAWPADQASCPREEGRRCLRLAKKAVVMLFSGFLTAFTFLLPFLCCREA